MEISKFHIKYTIAIVVVFLVLMMVECHKASQAQDEMQHAIDSLTWETEVQKNEIEELKLQLNDVDFYAKQKNSDSINRSGSNSAANSADGKSVGTQTSNSADGHNRRYVSPDK